MRADCLVVRVFPGRRRQGPQDCEAPAQPRPANEMVWCSAYNPTGKMEKRSVLSTGCDRHGHVAPPTEIQDPSYRKHTRPKARTESPTEAVLQAHSPRYSGARCAGHRARLGSARPGAGARKHWAARRKLPRRRIPHPTPKKYKQRPQKKHACPQKNACPQKITHMNPGTPAKKKNMHARGGCRELVCNKVCVDWTPSGSLVCARICVDRRGGGADAVG